MRNSLSKIDPVLLLLFAGMLVFTGVLIFVEYRFNSDGQVFQVIAGIVTGFTGAFFGRMKPDKDRQATATESNESNEPSPPPPPSVSSVS